LVPSLEQKADGGPAKGARTEGKAPRSASKKRHFTAAKSKSFRTERYIGSRPRCGAMSGSDCLWRAGNPMGSCSEGMDQP
ncbi:MAG: hypothetical protein IKC59_04380, partial [Clostridia bacterium]|nr:hypothetical protein [Clostridia bacterium]